MAMEMVLRRMKVEDATVHGFRSSFRDWAGNVSNFPRELIETTGRVFNTHKHELLMLSPATLQALLEIEAANLLEQGSHVGKWLKVLRTKDISDAAKRAIAQRMVDTGHTATSSAAPAPQ